MSIDDEFGEFLDFMEFLEAISEITGIDNLNGDYGTDGYSLDTCYEMFSQEMTPKDAAQKIVGRIEHLIKENQPA